jgi:hypothetical protein
MAEQPEYDGPNRMAGEKYADLMPPCFYCKHLQDIGFQDSAERWTCRAFPEGIPAAIWKRVENHNWLMPGQRGKYLYESRRYDNGEGYLEVITFEGDWVKAPAR